MSIGKKSRKLSGALAKVKGALVEENGEAFPAPKIRRVSIDLLVEADWNYKVAGTPEEIAKLANSIKRDRSAGVLPVRQLPSGMLESIDGNHRLRAIRLLQWKKVWVEDFGVISRAQAALIARRRNYNWFEDDILALGALLQDDVFKEFDPATLDSFMPEGYAALREIADVLLPTPTTPPELSSDAGTSSEPATPKAAQKKRGDDFDKLWAEWMNTARRTYGARNDLDGLTTLLDLAAARGHVDVRSE